MSWNPPSLSVFWPPFVRMSAAEEAQIIASTTTAIQAGIVTKRMALEKIRTVFPFENIEAVLTQLDDESAHRHEVEHMLAESLKDRDDDSRTGTQEDAT